MATSKTLPRRIPYAVANYEKLIGENFFHVDKTRFIHELEHYEIPVFLRPRRFGKSLWCSMLECYYDILRADRFDELFGHTDIGRQPTPNHNRWMVLRFDFSTIQLERNIDDLNQRFNEVCSLSFQKFIERYRSFFGDLQVDEGASASLSLQRCLAKISSNGLAKVMVIIDEYDNFTNQLLTTGQDQLYQHLTTGDSFLRTFYKALKTGVGEGSIAKVFITGVLPVTMDDLTSGFNIGQIITLEENTLNMMGFTQEELKTYVDDIFEDQGWSEELKTQVLEELKIHYNGYRFLPEAESVYNATICNYYLNKLHIGKGKIPTHRMDVNLKVDINWLKRLAGGATGDFVDALLTEGSLPADLDLFLSQFNRDKFLQKDFFPMSLFFLGLLSFEDEFRLGFPNLSVKTLFTEYFNELMNIKVSSGYGDMCQAFLKDHNLEGLFAGYWDRYIGQIPAQAFDKANENFYRTTFYEICQRYLSRHLAFGIEVNRPSGRSDFEALGLPGTGFESQAHVVEFKHLSQAKAKACGIMDWEQASEEDMDQVRGYARDLEHTHPQYRANCWVIYTIASTGFKCFKVPR